MTNLKTLIQELYEEELSDKELAESKDNLINLFLLLASVAKDLDNTQANSNVNAEDKNV